MMQPTVKLIHFTSSERKTQVLVMREVPIFWWSNTQQNNGENKNKEEIENIPSALWEYLWVKEEFSFPGVCRWRTEGFFGFFGFFLDCED